ncbi:hypothetical protein [Bdellovibrio sp.]|uniref:hypothetical protein n=1 Tax=Bdellovibrio sp. TaxID=28201 RepID=UPI003221FD94
MADFYSMRQGVWFIHLCFTLLAVTLLTDFALASSKTRRNSRPTDNSVNAAIDYLNSLPPTTAAEELDHAGAAGVSPANTDVGDIGGGCQQYADLQSACRQEIQATSRSCDEKNDSGMNGVTNTATQLGLMFGQQTGASIQAACSKMAGLSAAANSAVVAYRMICNNAIGRCRSACSSLKDFIVSNPACMASGFDGMMGTNPRILQTAEIDLDKCSEYENKVQEASQAITNLSSTMNNAAQCASLTAGDSAVVPDLCKTNPNLPGCAPAGPVDCTKPEMASNKVCVCSKNPTDPMCLSESTAGSIQLGSINSSARLTSQGAEGAGGGDFPGLPGIAPGKPGSGGTGEAVDGRQGGSANLASAGASGGGSSASSSGEAENTDKGHAVTAGFYGAGGGSTGTAASVAGGSGYGGQTGMSASGAGVSGPNLRQFLPGGKFDPKARGLAGTSGPDGITGPHSNIWMKIQNRYQVVRPTLMP